MKFVLNLVAATLAAIGAITLINLGVEGFSREKAIVKTEKFEPSRYVHRNGLDKAQLLCEKYGGILSIGGMYIQDGVRYELMCMYGKEMTFEILLSK